MVVPLEREEYGERLPKRGELKLRLSKLGLRLLDILDILENGVRERPLERAGTKEGARYAGVGKGLNEKGEGRKRIARPGLRLARLLPRRDPLLDFGDLDLLFLLGIFIIWDKNYFLKHVSHGPPRESKTFFQ